jgi:hypothetical protein
MTQFDKRKKPNCNTTEIKAINRNVKQPSTDEPNSSADASVTYFVILRAARLVNVLLLFSELMAKFHRTRGT